MPMFPLGRKTRREETKGFDYDRGSESWLARSARASVRPRILNRLPAVIINDMSKGFLVEADYVVLNGVGRPADQVEATSLTVGDRRAAAAKKKGRGRTDGRRYYVEQSACCLTYAGNVGDVNWPKSRARSLARSQRATRSSEQTGEANEQQRDLSDKGI